MHVVGVLMDFRVQCIVKYGTTHTAVSSKYVVLNPLIDRQAEEMHRSCACLILYSTYIYAPTQ